MEAAEPPFVANDDGGGTGDRNGAREVAVGGGSTEGAVGGGSTEGGVGGESTEGPERTARHGWVGTQWAPDEKHRFFRALRRCGRNPLAVSTRVRHPELKLNMPAWMLYELVC